MKDNHTNQILSEMRKLISSSLNMPLKEKETLQAVHISVLKMYFNAKEVIYNPETSEIQLQINDPESNDIFVKLSCENLEELLYSCLLDDAKSIYFYRNMISYCNMKYSA
ncbi:hypothetical protein [Aquimarina intermedia]|uniref:Uncharacterized protein n=1 Tax=Aquimarina intermedia TaxID=350814 RepID=A0A5S5C9F7_9FLAO|nr:hypothetical protein [Aquimarina intermedia]TYP76041.1 hypothetical protein BD809_102254 [Aquimarina intermedia]